MSRSNAPRLSIQWRFGLIAAMAMTFLALVPQFHLWAVRANDWQGTSASFDFDEVAYAAYLNALIDGRPRRNDPYTGRNDTPEQTLPESLHSIQFVPAYALALPARALGLSTGATFIIVRALAAFASTLALFWLLVLITSDSRVAAAGAIVVLCLGGLAGEPYHAWRIIALRWNGESLPFLRRYVPALVFPLFFIFVGLVWEALRKERKLSRLRTAALAGFVLTVLMFSYFFLWTAAIAWLFGIAMLWMWSERLKDRDAILVFVITAVFAALALVPYSFLLSRRAPTIDEAQLLTYTRAPILSLPVVIGLLVLLGLVIAVRFRRLQWREPAFLFTASFALLPAITFNQQLVTGLLLQPVHYGRYVSNYASVMALFLAGVMIWPGNRKQLTSKSLFSRILFFITLTVFGWAIVENGVRSARFMIHNGARDDAQRVAWRLRELAAAGSAETNASPLVFCSDVLLADALPTIAPQAILWSSHLFVFSGASALENRERLYQQLYYSGFDEQEFATLAGRPSFLQLALFGWERMSQKSYTRGLTNEDVRQETTLYAEYIAAFDATKAAAAPSVAYVVTPAIGGPSLLNFDRWYERDSGERIGDYVLYRTRRKEVSGGQ